MSSSLLKGLAEEKIVFLEPSKAKKFAFLFGGIVRIINSKGDTLGVVLDNSIIQEIEEEIEAASPEFLASLEASRQSGRISGKEVEKKANLK